MVFLDQVNDFDWESLKKDIYGKKSVDVEMALGKENRDIEDFKALVSPAALPFLEQMARLSKELTLKRFGKTIQMYIPVYLSNLCQNHCVYCGFNHNVNFHRVVLSNEEILQEIKAVRSLGYEHVLLVAGEHKNIGIDYYENVFDLIRPSVSHISIEVQPLEEDEYKKLIRKGLNTVYLYQETYHKKNYGLYHPAGKKADFNYRLDSYERMGRAGIHKMGLGVLLGLEDWRVDSLFTALHLRYLQKKYWKTRYSISFPRLRPNAGNFQPKNPITDKDLVQLICAYRLFDEDVEMSLSTREEPLFRDHVMTLGITSLSAGSKTEPGGYSIAADGLRQFEPGDKRSPSEVMQVVKKNGYETVWKDWDVFMQR